MQVSDQPPDNPGEVIDVSTPSPPPERNKGDQLAGAKRHPELTNDQEEPQVTGTPKRRWTDAGGTTKDTTMATVLEEDDEEESEMDEPGFQEKQEDPQTYEETTEEPLTFAEMYLYMHGELAGKELQDAKETVSVMEYVRSMFKTVFKTHPTQSLAESKRHYPELTDEETDQLLRLFLMDIAVGRADTRKWRARLYDIVRSVYKTRRSMMDIVDHRIATSQAAVAPVVNAWTQQNEQQKTDNENDMDVDMTGVDNSPYRFLKSVYTASEITLYRKNCETPYGFPSKIRKPTEKEKNIIRGLLEGSILCAHLPAFLKRVCTNAALRMIQNTIQAQVEGDLVLQLPTDFPVYPDFQSRERLVGMILLGIRKSEHPEVVALLKNAKQVCYDKRGHAVHLIFWTREQAAMWGKEFKTLPFRNRNFALRNEHAEEVDTPMDPQQRSTTIWARQMGADGIRDEKPRGRYHVRLLNVSRFMDEAALDTFIQMHFRGTYTTWQEPSVGNRERETDTWDIYFRSPLCPPFLAGRRFLDWDGTKILIHHANWKPAPPCFQCGASGHTRNRCNVADNFWNTSEYCIHVTAEEIEGLPRQPGTITSFEQLAEYWIDEEEEQSNRETIGVVNQQQVPAIQLLQRELHPTTTTPIRRLGEAPVDNQARWQTVGQQNNRRSDKRTGELIAPRPPPGAPQRNPVTPRKPDRIFENDQKPNEKQQCSSPVAPPAVESPAETIKATLSQRTQKMQTLRGLIAKLIEERRLPSQQQALEAISKLQHEQFEGVKAKGNQVLKVCGLQETSTPRNGNCQYYAVASALLNRDFQDNSSKKPLEILTSKLKKCIVAASEHFFFEEFEQQAITEILTRLEESDQQLTREQSAQALRTHFIDLGKSDSKLNGYIAGRHWGTDETLRMMAKILQRNIFVVIARSGLEKATYQQFEPAQVTKSGKTYSTVKERNFGLKQANKWIQAIKEDCKRRTTRNELPIVLLYRPKHYCHLRFTAVNVGSDPVESNPAEPMEVSLGEVDEEMIEIADTTPQSSQRETGNQSETAERKMTLSEMMEHQEEEIFGQGRLQELRTFTTAGVHGIAPGRRQELRDLQWSDEQAVAQWLQLYEVDLETLKLWQTELLQEGPSSTFTPSQSSDIKSSGSVWEEEMSEVQEELDLNQKEHPPDTSGGRFEARITTISSTRARHKELRKQWNALATQWEADTKDKFPTLPATTETWKLVVHKAPGPLLSLLQQYQSPDYILSAMTDAILDQWTVQARLECLVHCLSIMMERATNEGDNAQAKWVEDRIKELQQQAAVNVQELNLHSSELWKQLKQQKYGGLELLKMCRKGRTKYLTRAIVAAHVYASELLQLTGDTNQLQQQTSTIGYLDVLFAVTQDNPKINSTIHQEDTIGLWTKLEEILASRSGPTSDGNDAEGELSPQY